MSLITIDGSAVEVVESINQVRSALNKLVDPENVNPFHAGSFTRKDDGHRVIVAMAAEGLTLIASGEISRRQDDDDAVEAEHTVEADDDDDAVKEAEAAIEAAAKPVKPKGKGTRTRKPAPKRSAKTKS
jgi:hypothetical protein